MANQFKGEVEISLGGKKLMLRPSFEGLLQIEDKAGAGLSVVLKSFLQNEWRIRYLAAVIHGGLFHYENEDYSFEAVGKVIVDDGLKGYMMPALELISKSISPPQPKEAKEKGKKEQAATAT